ncbi:MAG: ATP-binding cassette domain-containing protein [Planctomycetota bacterium]|jgi:molybdate transport system ATP-binding protein|nr:ATP-binding cassette domain-containing protein [Planctomycetota bacterium]
MTLEVGIRKRLGKSFTLDVSFETDGDCLGILGASGGGKSMALKCVAGIESPDSGRIVVNGRLLFDSERGINLRPQERRVGYLFQDYALFPRMSLERNIGIAIPGRAAARAAKTAELCGRFHLRGLEKRLPDQLSGGQRQRAALARMLAAEPEVILLDEPFSALDASLREEMQMRMLELLRHCRDAVMVSHSRDEIYRLCGKTLILEAGTVLAHGGTRELFKNPGCERAAVLTGCKNISPARKTGERSLFALGWGLSLATDRPVPDSLGFVGIRAHDFVPYTGDGGGDNLVEMRIKARAEDPFEWNVLFTNANAADGSGNGELWWKYSKYAALGDALPRRLFIPPEAILQLTG